MGVVAKRSSMIFFSDPSDYYCHRVRIVLAEKDVAVEVKEAALKEKISELTDFNPYNSLPTLVDRDLVLYESTVMMEYLDERFPHPPLLPPYPVLRAKSRLMIHRIQKDICELVDTILNPVSEPDVIEQSRKELYEQLLSISPVFKEFPYFLSEEFSLVDCCILPVLWRLPLLGIELPAQAQPLLDYAERLFQRDSFKISLSEPEEDMRA